MVEEASRMLDIRDQSKPFFMYFAHQEIHIPLQAPPEPEYAELCADVTATENRNTLCQMTARLDKSIGDFVDMLKARDMWEDTLLWITTDNGGMTQYQTDFPGSASSNFPLRGGKTTLFEGGVRGVLWPASARRHPGDDGSPRWHRAPHGWLGRLERHHQRCPIPAD